MNRDRPNSTVRVVGAVERDYIANIRTGVTFRKGRINYTGYWVHCQLTGSFPYSPVAGTVLTARQQTLTAIFTPTDTKDYTIVSASVTLTVNQATPAAICLRHSAERDTAECQLTRSRKFHLFFGGRGGTECQCADTHGDLRPNGFHRPYNGFGERHSNSEQSRAHRYLSHTRSNFLRYSPERDSIRRHFDGGGYNYLFADSRDRSRCWKSYVDSNSYSS